MTSSKLVKLTKADSVFEAHAIRGFLESHGITCIIADEHLVNANWAIKHAIGDIRINVYDKDLDKAKDLLQTVNTAQCPPTEQNKVATEQKPSFLDWLVSILLSIITSVPVPIKNRKNKN